MSLTVTQKNINVETMLDKEFEFYELYLNKYTDVESENNLIEVEVDTATSFDILTETYFNGSASSNQNEKTDEEALADSFVFFVANGVISEQCGSYYIDKDKLSKVKEQYDNAAKEKGNSYKKGTK